LGNRAAYFVDSIRLLSAVTADVVYDLGDVLSTCKIAVTYRSIALGLRTVSYVSPNVRFDVRSTRCNTRDHQAFEQAHADELISGATRFEYAYQS
jgi:hypothetical protein